MMLHRRSFCGPDTNFVTAGQPHEEDEPAGGTQIVSTSTARSLPLVAAGGANAHPHLQHLLYPCGCMHDSLYMHPYYHNLQSLSHNTALCLPTSVHTVNHATANQLIQAPESLCIELPAACSHMSLSHNHAHAHHHPLPLPEPAKSLEMVRKVGSDPVYGSVQTIALNNGDKAICRSIAPICNKLYGASFKTMHAETLCCAAHIRMLPRCSHTDADVSRLQTQVADRCQIHPNCVAPINLDSAFEAQQMPEVCRPPPSSQIPPKVEVAPQTHNNTVFVNHRKEFPFGSTSKGYKEADFWAGTPDKLMQGGNDGNNSKGGGRGFNGNSWRGGRNLRGRGSNYNTNWNWGRIYGEEALITTPTGIGEEALITTPTGIAVRTMEEMAILGKVRKLGQEMAEVGEGVGVVVGGSQTRETERVMVMIGRVLNRPKCVEKEV